MGLKVGEVKLENYNNNWKVMFEEEKKNLKSIFKDLAISIEHIGSTSIEGLKAKPIIDIAVGIRDFKDFERVKENFLELPYSVKEDSDPDERLIRKGDENNRTHFIHVMKIDSPRYKNSIIFRDYLRKNEDVKKEYEKLKTDLAKKYEHNRKEYTKAKNDFIQKILELAQK